MAWSPIQSKKQSNKKSIGVGAWIQKKGGGGGGGGEVGKILKKEGREYSCGLKKNRGPLIMVYTHMQ